MLMGIAKTHHLLVEYAIMAASATTAATATRPPRHEPL